MNRLYNDDGRFIVYAHSFVRSLSSMCALLEISMCVNVLEESLCIYMCVFECLLFYLIQFCVGLMPTLKITFRAMERKTVVVAVVVVCHLSTKRFEGNFKMLSWKCG